jgi:hypothetical protein
MWLDERRAKPALGESILHKSATPYRFMFFSHTVLVENPPIDITIIYLLTLATGVRFNPLLFKLSLLANKTKLNKRYHTKPFFADFRES